MGKSTPEEALGAVGLEIIDKLESKVLETLNI